MPDRRDPTLETRLEQLEKAVLDLKEELTTNTALTAEVKELLQIGKTVLTIMRWTGVVAKWVTAISAAVYTILHITPPNK